MGEIVAIQNFNCENRFWIS